MAMKTDLPLRGLLSLLPRLFPDVQTFRHPLVLTDLAEGAVPTVSYETELRLMELSIQRV